MLGQIDLFEGVTIAKPEPKTTVRLGRKTVQIPLQRKRREALAHLTEILEELEGKDIHIGSYHSGGGHFWLDNLKLAKLRLEWFPYRLKNDWNYLPEVIVLWGNRSASVRIFTDYLIDVRVQEYYDCRHYLLDFRNGFWQSPIDTFKSHYACLQITRFK